MINPRKKQGSTNPTLHIEKSNGYIWKVKNFPTTIPGFTKENNGTIYEEIVHFVTTLDEKAQIRYKTRTHQLLGKTYPLERTLYLDAKFKDTIQEAFPNPTEKEGAFIYHAYLIPDHYSKIKDLIEREKDVLYTFINDGKLVKLVCQTIVEFPFLDIEIENSK